MNNALAYKNPAVQTAEQSDQYLTFRIGREMFAINILHIREIMEYGNLTTVPMMPEFVSGVINLRGSVVPVVDLKCRFGFGRNDTRRRTCIIILEIHGDENELREIGLIVDEVSEVREIASADIEPPPSFGARIRTDFIAGMGKIHGTFVILLQVSHVLNFDEMTALANIHNP